MAAITGLVVIAVGVFLIVIGAVMAWREEAARRERGDKGVQEFVDALAKLMDALAKHPVGVRLIALGIVLVFLGGTIAGFAGLTACPRTPA